MGANTRYRGTYYNTTATGTGNRTMKIEILDTETVASVTKVQIMSVDESFEGLDEDLRPGVFPSSFKFTMAIRNAPKTIGAHVYGTNSDFITDIFTSPEGRFLVRLLIDDVMVGIYTLIYDQCSYEDVAYPFILQITAVDGLTRLQTEKYVSEVGQIVYYSMIDSLDPPDTYDTTPLLYDGPITGVTPMTVIEHTVQRHVVGNLTYWTQVTTFAHREIYAKKSPGTGWVYQGEGKWAKSVPTTNEIETEDVGISYHLTRDIDDDRHRPISEIFKRAIQATNLTSEYPDPDVMYDVTMQWYEHDMANFDDDPTTMARVHEYALIDKTWAEALTHVCRLVHMRIYFAQGRYHFEQIATRDDAIIKRYPYKADGTSAGVPEEVDLDLDFAALEIQPETGGTHKVLAPFSYVEAYIKLDNADLLQDVRWYEGAMGQKYLGRIKRSAGTQEMVITMQSSITSTFDPAILAILNPNLVNSLCSHTVRIYTQIRLTNVELGTVYYLNADGTSGVWDTDEYTFERTVPFGNPTYVYSAENYGYTKVNNFIMGSDNIPDPEGALYDVHISVTIGVEWANSNAQNLWQNLNPDKHWHILSSNPPGSGPFVNSMRFYNSTDHSPETEHPDTVAQGKTYFVENDTANTLEVKTEAQWADTGQFEKAIQIWDGTKWKNSAAWSINGVGDPMEILQLLVNEIMSLRMLPRKMYSGAFISSLPSPDNRFLRGTTYYLPLSCSRDTSFDTYRGEFVEIAKTTPPAGDVIGQPFEGSPIPGLSGVGDSNPDSSIDPIPITLETNATISAAATLTQVAIVNTAEAFIQSGTDVTIMHPTSGVQEVVTLTQDIDPDSTIMYFSSHTFAFAYPDASLILPNVDDGLVPTSLAQYYYFFKQNYTATEISAPNFSFINPEGYGAQNINKRYKVFRNGIRIFYNGAPGSNPTKRKSSYYYDHVTKKWKFWIGLADETIEIEAY